MLERNPLPNPELSQEQEELLKIVSNLRELLVDIELLASINLLPTTLLTNFLIIAAKILDYGTKKTDELPQQFWRDVAEKKDDLESSANIQLEAVASAYGDPLNSLPDSRSDKFARELEFVTDFFVEKKGSRARERTDIELFFLKKRLIEEFRKVNDLLSEEEDQNESISQEAKLKFISAIRRFFSAEKGYDITSARGMSKAELEEVKALDMTLKNETYLILALNQVPLRPEAVPDQKDSLLYVRMLLFKLWSLAVRVYPNIVDSDGNTGRQIKMDTSVLLSEDHTELLVSITDEMKFFLGLMKRFIKRESSIRYPIPLDPIFTRDELYGGVNLSQSPWSRMMPQKEIWNMIEYKFGSTIEFEKNLNINGEKLRLRAYQSHSILAELIYVLSYMIEFVGQDKVPEEGKKLLASIADKVEEALSEEEN